MCLEIPVTHQKHHQKDILKSIIIITIILNPRDAAIHSAISATINTFNFWE